MRPSIRRSSNKITFALLIFAAIFAAVYGWVHNIVTLVQIAGDPITGMFILRCIGIFIFPVGMVLGFL